jgi:hypothetical protein
MFIDWIWAAIGCMMEPVLKPIKAGINNWLRGIGYVIRNNVNKFSSNPSQELSTNGISDALFGSFTYILIGIITVVGAVMTLVSPFLSIVAGLLKDVVNFIEPIITNTLCGGGKKGGTKSKEGWDCITNWIYNYIGATPTSQTKGQPKADDNFYYYVGGFLGILSAIFASIKVYLKGKEFLSKSPIKKSNAIPVILAFSGIVMVFVSQFGGSFGLRKIDAWMLSAAGMGLAWWGFLNAISSGSFGAFAYGITISICLISTLNFALFTLKLFDLSKQNQLDLFSSV